ncbi:MAG: hypothetical protein A3F14_00990 [Gammaproteobacteria bacterium RIFCSPHIGHO2_12_FULL_43_28]|nr:MAG: hypothetical protein A3F14_00990 [Gammaproteobacteria bacterium RIFCSPHIGHO2_12_FULL_43_28]
MRAMILAAGRGERMGVLTAKTPKPLLKVGQHYLIEYALSNLKRAGVIEIVINIAYHATLIKNALGDGRRYGLTIHYSEEENRLETGGGIFKALPLLGDEPFLVMSSDIITHYPLEKLPRQLTGLAHLVMIANPSYHPNGDFGLRDGIIDQSAKPTFTFANIGVYHPDLFSNCKPGYFPLKDVLLPAISDGRVTGEMYAGSWYNVGTPADLQVVSTTVMPACF